MMIPPISPRRIVRKCGHLHSAWRKSPVGDLCFQFHLWNRPGNWAEFRRQLEPQPGRSTDRRLECDRHTLRSDGSQSEDRAAVPENCRSRLLMLRTARKCARSHPRHRGRVLPRLAFTLQRSGGSQIPTRPPTPVWFHHRQITRSERRRVVRTQRGLFRRQVSIFAVTGSGTLPP